MTDTPDHSCPGCGAPLPFVARHPWHFCPACLSGAQSGHGRRLSFGTASPDGGFFWRYADEDGSGGEAAAVICLIRQRRVIVGEAKFGGVVAEPLGGLPPRGTLDLSRRPR